MYCPKCGNVLDDNSKFCPRCGYRVGNDSTKEINIGVIKDLSKKSDLNVVKPKKNNVNNGNVVVALLLVIIIIILVFILAVAIKNNRRVTTKQDINEYCKTHSTDTICGNKEEEKNDFDVLDFSSYSFDVSTSKEGFVNQVKDALTSKEEEGNKYCNNTTYTKLNSHLDKSLNLNYSYTCNVDEIYMNNVVNRLNDFYRELKIPEALVNSYLVGRREPQVYADFSFKILGFNENYYGYIKRIYINSNTFSDYDVVKKSYERDLTSKFHPKNSKPEDVIVHETAHALDYYIFTKKMNIENLVIDDTSKYGSMIDSWNNQTYSTQVVKEAVKRVNDKLRAEGKNARTEISLREEISGYAKQLYAETFAEAMVDYFVNKDNASPLSIEMYKIVEQDLISLGGK